MQCEYNCTGSNLTEWLLQKIIKNDIELQRYVHIYMVGFIYKK